MGGSYFFFVSSYAQVCFCIATSRHSTQSINYWRVIILWQCNGALKSVVAVALCVVDQFVADKSVKSFDEPTWNGCGSSFYGGLVTSPVRPAFQFTFIRMGHELLAHSLRVPCWVDNRRPKVNEKAASQFPQSLS